MLVLSRRSGQGIRIGDDILIRVRSEHGSSRVRIAIAAPRDLSIVRDEIFVPGSEVVEIECRGRLPEAVYAGRWLFRRRIRERVFKPSYLEFVADYVQAQEENQAVWRRFSFCLIFTLRAIGLYLGCLGASAPLWLVRRLESARDRLMRGPFGDDHLFRE